MKKLQFNSDMSNPVEIICHTTATASSLVRSAIFRAIFMAENLSAAENYQNRMHKVT